MKKSRLLLAVFVGAVGAYLVYDETAGLGKAERPPQAIAPTPPPKGVPFQQRGFVPTERTLPPREVTRDAQRRAPAPPSPAARTGDERELDDVGDWQYDEMEQAPQPPAAKLQRSPGRGNPDRPRLGPEKKFDAKDPQ